MEVPRKKMWRKPKFKILHEIQHILVNNFGAIGNNVTKLVVISFGDWMIWALRLLHDCLHVFQIGLLYGQFEGSGDIMRKLTISDDSSPFYSSSNNDKGVFKRFAICVTNCPLVLTTATLSYFKLHSVSILTRLTFLYVNPE